MARGGLNALRSQHWNQCRGLQPKRQRKWNARRGFTAFFTRRRICRSTRSAKTREKPHSTKSSSAARLLRERSFCPIAGRAKRSSERRGDLRREHDSHRDVEVDQDFTGASRAYPGRRVVRDQYGHERRPYLSTASSAEAPSPGDRRHLGRASRRRRAAEMVDEGWSF